MHQWKDVTSHSRDSKDRTPRSWQLMIGKLRLLVTHHIYHPGQWVFTCEPFFSQREIGAITHPPQVMQAHALDLLSRELETCRAALEPAS